MRRRRFLPRRPGTTRSRSLFAVTLEPTNLNNTYLRVGVKIHVNWPNTEGALARTPVAVHTSQPLRLLVIDDHEISMVVLRTVLRQRGHVCEGTTNVEEALVLMASLRPHAIFYEWNLRGGRGEGLVGRLRASAEGTAVLIVVSTLDEPTDFLDAHGVDAYVRKPFDIEVIESLLERLCMG